ncbi:hypothetical protein [Endozoicomonas ascidiicola]|uniref:hypothetical protein n=1 Tax=Endozoicomonas ascidiicola TaxID=1698521 RepID=UPI000834B939|nr:hypothetical protein [Endozoicomonas ascidiicola]
MADSINKAGTTSDAPSMGAVSGSEQSPKGEISSGYSPESTVSRAKSHEKGISVSTKMDSVTLDEPSMDDSGDVNTELPFQKKLKMITGQLSSYNDYLRTGNFDFQADSTTLLIVLRGMISDLKIVNNAQRIATAAEERRQYQEMKLEVAVLVTEIAQIGEQLVALRLELADIIRELASTQAVHGQLMLALTAAQGGVAENHNDIILAVQQAYKHHPEVISVLKDINTAVKNGNPVNPEHLLLINEELSELGAEMSEIQEEIKKLKASIEAAEKARAEKLTELTVKEVLFTLYLYEDIIHRALSVEPGRVFFKENIESGEERLHELKLELQRLRQYFESEEMEQVLQDELARIQQLDFTNVGSGQTEKVASQAAGEQRRKELIQQIFGGLLKQYAPGQIREANDFRVNDSTPDYAVEDIYQALSVILLARDFNGDHVGHSTGQTYLGDNLSLEGADSPIVFARLLLTEQLSEFGDALIQQAGLEQASKEQVNSFLDSEMQMQELMTVIQKGKEDAQATIKKGGWA